MNAAAVKNVTYQSILYVRTKLVEFSHSGLAKKLWAVANKIKNFVFFWQTSPFVRTFEEQQTFNVIKNRYQDISRTATVPNPTPSPLTGKSVTTLLSSNGSKPIEQLRQLARQIAEAGFASAQEEIEHPELKSALKELAPIIPALCDIFSGILCRMIQNLSFEKMIDSAVAVIDAEIKGHIQAQKHLDEEKKRIDYAKEVCRNPTDETPRAAQFLGQVISAGTESLKKETYATAYDEALASGFADADAQVKAAAAREGIKNHPSFANLCVDAYLRDYYMTKFALHEGMTVTVKQIALARGIDRDGSQYLDVRNYLHSIAAALSNEMIGSFKNILNDAVFPLTFWISYLKTDDALNMNALKQQSLAHVIQPFMTKALVKLLEMLVIPQKFNKLIAANVLPPVEDQLIHQICRYVISANWKELAPYLYAYEIANAANKQAIFHNIAGKLWDKTITKEIAFQDIPKSQFNKAALGFLQHYSHRHHLLRQVLLEKAGSNEFSTLNHYFYELVVTCRASHEGAKQRESTLATLKTIAQSICAERIKDQDPEAFYTVITPLIMDLEKKLIKRCDNAGEEVVTGSFVKRCLLGFLKNGSHKTYRKNPTAAFGDLVFNLGFQWGGLAPRTHFYSRMIPFGHRYVKNQINTAIKDNIAVYRHSHHQIIKTVVESLISKFANDAKTGIDKAKTKAVLFGRTGEVDKDEIFYDCWEEEPSLDGKLKALASLTFGLSQQLPAAFVTNTPSQSILQRILQMALLGNNEKALAAAIAKIKPGFCDHRLINLNRTAQLAHILAAALRETHVKINKTKGSL